jgi:hypothetical protein
MVESHHVRHEFRQPIATPICGGLAVERVGRLDGGAALSQRGAHNQEEKLAAVNRVDRYCRVRLADERAFREWSMRVLEVAATFADADMAATRPVVLVPRRLPSSGPLYGYVHTDALGAVLGIVSGVELDGEPVPLREVPGELTVLVGADVDAAANERRAPD